MGNLLKVLEYKKGEQVRDWYRRHGVATANFEPELVPFYLLLVGPPTLIPFEFQYLLGIEYAVGRLAFDSAAEYASYARSVVAYESASAINNAKEIVYWGTRHPADPATNLSAKDLIEPLADGIDHPQAPSLKKPVHEQVGYARQTLRRRRSDQGQSPGDAHVRTAPRAPVHRLARALAEGGSARPARRCRAPCSARTGRDSAP